MQEMIEAEHNIVAKEDFLDEYATELHFAVKENNLRSIRKLIEGGVRVHAPDKFGRTPLHWALVFGYQDVARALIINTNRRSLDYRDNFGCTPLHYAASGGRTEVGRILVERGAQINTLDSKRRTPLHYAAQNVKPITVEMLISRGADKESLDYRGFLPCDIAVEWGSFSSLVCLRPDSLKMDFLEQKIHRLNISDAKEEDGREKTNEGVLKNGGPSLEKLLKSWKIAEQQTQLKNDADTKAAAKAAAVLKEKLGDWREAEQEARQRKQEGAATPSLQSLYRYRRDPVLFKDEFSDSDKTVGQTGPPIDQPFFTSSSSSHSLAFPSAAQETLDSSSSLGNDLLSTVAAGSRSATFEVVGDVSSPGTFTPDFSVGASNLWHPKVESFGGCRDRENEFLRWCTEWEAEFPERAAAGEESSRKVERSSPGAFPKERSEGKAKAFCDEEPVWVQVWPKSSSLSPRSKTVTAV